MGKDTRATDAGSVGEAGLRARGSAARRAAGDSRETGSAGGNTIGPFELNEAQLTALGQKIGATVELPVIFALHGDLGAGKSVLARGIAQGAGVRAHMPSPTFNLLFQYEAGDKVVSHLDLYRLEDPGEVWELGWRDLGVENQIVLIEWPERAHELLPEPRWDVFLAASENGALLRRVSFRAVGDPPPLSIDTP